MSHTPHQPFLLSLPAWCSASLLGTVSGEIQVWKACAAGNGGILVSRNIGKASISLAVRYPIHVCTHLQSNLNPQTKSTALCHSPVRDRAQTPSRATGLIFFHSLRFTPSYINVSAPTFCRSSCKLLHSFSLIRWCPFFLFLKDSSQNKSTPRASSGERTISFPPSTLSLRNFFSPTHPESTDMCVFLCNCVLPIREKESREKRRKKDKNTTELKPEKKTKTKTTQNAENIGPSLRTHMLRNYSAS